MLFSMYYSNVTHLISVEARKLVLGEMRHLIQPDIVKDVKTLLAPC